MPSIKWSSPIISMLKTWRGSMTWSRSLICWGKTSSWRPLVDILSISSMTHEKRTEGQATRQQVIYLDNLSKLWNPGGPLRMRVLLWIRYMILMGWKLRFPGNLSSAKNLLLLKIQELLIQRLSQSMFKALPLQLMVDRVKVEPPHIKEVQLLIVVEVGLLQPVLEIKVAWRFQRPQSVQEMMTSGKTRNPSNTAELAPWRWLTCCTTSRHFASSWDKSVPLLTPWNLRQLNQSLVETHSRPSSSWVRHIKR